ncbi:MAG: thioredoxin family protein, partial [Pirellulaceae bacterium]|nr:thioredoxin family protein [Pirellulaceae bacterium]
MKKTTLTLAIMILFPCLSSAMAEPPKLATVLDDENGLGAEFWMYNDIQAAMKEARLQNKPLFVTFRCVPCEDCLAFDAEVAKGSNVIRELAVKHFIPVRQVEMKGVDLSLFQFDHDLNWAAMFINADGVIYARYGTQSAAGADAYNSIEGLRQTMLRVLQLQQDDGLAVWCRARGSPGAVAVPFR